MGTPAAEHRNWIAIVGMAGRFPGARNLAEFWRNIRDGVESITFFRDEDLLRAGVDPAVLCDPAYVKAAPLLPDADRFDAEFFCCSRRDAEIMDPQHRVFLETAWEALEDAGCAGSRGGRSIGVFAGAGGLSSSYFCGQGRVHPRLMGPTGSIAAVSIDKDYLATRVSYKLNLRGPSITVQTACSTSLVAVHLACQSLLLGECELALAGAVTVRVPQIAGYCCKDDVLLSPDGHCRAFDAAAQGTVFGSGVGVVVLKPLENALADRDRIHAVIRGSAINNDGSEKLSFWASNAEAQAAAVLEAQLVADVEPDTIQYLEAHGTGTSMGDPVEVAALGEAFRARTDRTGFCAIGSVKTNIGHTEAAAGIAGLIKTVLALEDRVLPPTLNYREPNPRIDFATSPFYVNTKLENWEARTHPRRAAVHCLGIGGTNVHVVLEEAPKVKVQPAAVDRPRHLLTLSAKTPKALDELAAAYQEHFQKHEDCDFASACFTANTGRGHFEHRLALVAGSAGEARNQLAAFRAGRDGPGVFRGQVRGEAWPGVAFVFPESRFAYPNMGRQLYETQPTFRRLLQQCDELAQASLGRSLLAVMYPPPGQDVPLDEFPYAPLAVFALEYALFHLWTSWGIAPAWLLGHGIGEYAAACTAEVFELDDAVKLIIRSISSLREGPDDTPVAAPERVCGEVVFKRPQIGVVSGVLGRPVRDEIADPAYWCRRQGELEPPARGVKALVERGGAVLLEVGPASRLKDLVGACLPEPSSVGLGGLRRGTSDWQPLLEALAAMYVAGMPIDWGRFDADYPRRKVALPTYPFQRERYWIEPPAPSHPVPSSAALETRPAHPLLGRPLRSAGREVVFACGLGPSAPALLEDHRIYGKVIVPASAYLEMALAAGAGVWPGESVVIRDVTFHEALRLPADGVQTVQLVVAPKTPDARAFEVFSLDGRQTSEPWSWRRHVSGTLAVAPGVLEPEAVDLDAVKARCPDEVSGEEHYRRLQQRGTDLGPCFQSVERLWVGDKEALGEIRLPPSPAADSADYHLHPVLLDACVQVSAALAEASFLGKDDLNASYLPVAFEEVRLCRRPETAALARARLREAPCSHAAVSVDVQLLGPAGEVLADVTNLELKQASRRLVVYGLEYNPDDWLYLVAWSAKDRERGADARPAREVGTWLIFADRKTVGPGLAEFLCLRGERCVLVRPGRSYEALGPDRYRVNPARPGDFRRLVADAFADGQAPCRGVVYLWSLDATGPARAALGAGLPTSPKRAPDVRGQETLAQRGVEWERELLLSCGGPLHLVQALAGVRFGVVPRLWLVTRGGQPVGGDGTKVQLAQSPLWGLGRVIAVEHPELRCVRVDLDPGAGSDELENLFEEIYFPDEEDQVAFRQGVRYVPRLRQHAEESSPPLAIPDASPFRLELGSYGDLDTLTLRPCHRRRPGPGEVEIAVRAWGLNFRDVLRALGMLREYEKSLLGETSEEVVFGFECAGTIACVGEGVVGLEVADEVLALASGSMASQVTVPADHVVRKPDGMSFEEAAATGVVFTTAHHALNDLAKLSTGERVLIHAAAGGVGQAAVQLAQQAGAEVLATASPAKWEFLRSQRIRNVISSRTLDFAEQVLKLTDGEGVDVVLNSLNGEFIPKSLSVLKPGGRFVEIGAIGIWDASEVAALREDVSYFRFDLLDEERSNPGTIRALLENVLGQFRQGLLKPLPCRVFPLENAVEAFRHVARARHVGKVVISLAGSKHEPLNARTMVRRDGSYLVTGGLGALGLQLAGWLVDQGARHLVLVGRKGASSPTAQAIVSRLEATGAELRVLKADVSEAEAVARAVASAREMAPLRGIVHAAGVLEDGMLFQQDWPQFRRVMTPKIAGAWNLHRTTLDAPLDFFICFSSIASLFGSPGQANYAAANAFLDTLAYHRRSQGLPGLTIAWGPWSQLGLAARLAPRHHARWASMGLGEIDPADGLALFGRVGKEESPLIAVVPIDWSTWLGQSPVPPFFAEVYQSLHAAACSAQVCRAGRSGRPSPSAGFLERLKESPVHERYRLLRSHVEARVARVLGLWPTARLPSQQGFAELGMDSLSSVELRNALQASLATPLPSTLTFDYPNLDTLVDYLAYEVLSWEPPGQPAAELARQAPHLRHLSDQLDGLTEGEMAEILKQKLSQIREADS